jgi:hypothetical protein
MTARMGRPIELPSPWRELALALGSVTALAEACGASVRTVQRWADGSMVPRAIVKKHVNALARRRGLEEPWR